MTKGIDLSHYQRVDNWAAVADACSFVYHKASEGRGTDPNFVTALQGAREEAMSVGGYHFFRPDVAVDTQRKAFGDQLAAISLGDGDLVPALDVEEEPPLVFSPGVYVTGVTEMVNGLLADWGQCVIYTTQRDWGRLGNPEILLDPRVILWVAHYTLKAAPSVPPGKTWQVWQHSGSGAVPGVSSSQGVDLNVATVLPVLGQKQQSPDFSAVGESLRAQIEALWAGGHEL